MRSTIGVLLLHLWSIWAYDECPIGEGHCSCFASDGGHNVWCPDSQSRKIRIFFKPGSVWIICNSDVEMSSADLLYELSGIDFGGQGLEHLAFKHCVLPEVDYANVTFSMNISSIQTFVTEFSQMPDRTFIPGQFEGLSESLTRIIIRTSNNYIESSERNIFVSGMFRGLRRLTVLQLTNNGVISLPEDLLEPLSALNYLSIREPDLKEIPIENFLKNQTNLTSLIFSGESLARLPSRLLDPCKKLTDLALIKTNFTENGIPSDLFYNSPFLKSINVSGNFFAQSPPALFVRNSKLELLQWTYYRCSDPECELTLQNFLEGLASLETFRIRLNSRPKVIIGPDFFKGCTNLKTVEIVGARVDSIPEGLFRDSLKLVNVDLSRNEISNLPDTLFQRLIKLETLLLSQNRLTALNNDNFADLKSLKKLAVSGNVIRELEKNVFYHTAKLEELDLSGNVIDFDERTEPRWNSLTKLKKMDLSNNNLSVSHIHNDFAIILLNLEDLNLSYNRIGSTINAFDFDFMQNQIEVDLRHNKIETISFEFYSYQNPPISSRIPIIYLEGNPLFCDCRALDFYQAIREIKNVNFKIGDSAKLTCAQPREYSEISLTEMKTKELSCEFPSPLLPSHSCPCHSCSFVPSDSLITVDCSHFNMTRYPLEMPSSIRKSVWIALNMSGNAIVDAEPPSAYKNNLTELYLTQNEISRLFQKIPENLEILHLDRNFIEIIYDSLLKQFDESPSLKELRLAGNPFPCNCDSEGIYRFVKDHYDLIKDVENVTLINCDEDGSYLILVDIEDEEIFCVDVSAIVVIYVLPVIMVLLVLLVILVFVLYYKEDLIIILYQYPLFRRIFIQGDKNSNKPYDVFIGYSHEDEDYVEKELCKGLEDPQDDPLLKYKCLLAVRDFIPGTSIAQQILYAVENSSRTIIVLSKAFIKSEWAQYEFDVAHEQKKVILLKYGDLPNKDEMGPVLQKYIAQNTYIEHDHVHFWRNLRYALPHRGRAYPWPKWFRTRYPTDQMQLITPRGTSPNGQISSNGSATLPI